MNILGLGVLDLGLHQDVGMVWLIGWVFLSSIEFCTSLADASQLILCWLGCALPDDRVPSGGEIMQAEIVVCL